MTDLPANTYLSRYFSDLQQMRGWLDRIGGLDVVQAGTRHIAALPSAYTLTLDWKHEKQMRQGQKPTTIDGHVRDKYIPARFEISADSKVESLCQLASAVLAHFNQASARKIYIHPQGQSAIEEISYFCIRRNDPWHDHDNKEQIDFTVALLDRKEKKIVLPSYDDNHTHLIHPDHLW